MMPRDDLLEFWRSPVPDGNNPTDFLDATDRSRILGKLIDAPRTSRILEVGCGPGRNLAHLANLGYKRLEGVEINPHSIALLRTAYPELRRATIHEGAAEDVLPRLKLYRVVYTMAFLEHLHPESHRVFWYICRLATHSIIAVEPTKGHESTRQHPYNIRHRFEQCGAKLVAAHDLSAPEWQPNDLPTYTAWVFAAPANVCPEYASPLSTTA